MFGNAIEQALQAASNYLVFYYSAHTCRNNSEKAERGGGSLQTYEHVVHLSFGASSRELVFTESWGVSKWLSFRRLAFNLREKKSIPTKSDNKTKKMFFLLGLGRVNKSGFICRLEPSKQIIVHHHSELKFSLSLSLSIFLNHSSKNSKPRNVWERKICKRWRKFTTFSQVIATGDLKSPRASCDSGRNMALNFFQIKRVFLVAKEWKNGKYVFTI